MITTNELNVILAEELEKFDSLGFNRREVKPTIKIDDHKSRYGSMNTGSGQMTLTRSFVINASINEVRATIMHEICHQVKGSYGHDSMWQGAVKMAFSKFGDTYENGEYHLHPHPYSKHRRTLPHTNLRASINIDTVTYKYEIKCEKCGQSIRRSKLSKVITSPSSYKCGICGGKFVRVK